MKVITLIPLPSQKLFPTLLITKTFKFYKFSLTNVSYRMLDLAFNRITEIKGLGNLTNLKKLFLSANKISKIENLENLKNLELLELGDNKIRVSHCKRT